MRPTKLRTHSSTDDEHSTQLDDDQADTLRDAFGILNGGDTPATKYYGAPTSDTLRIRFLPIANPPMQQVNPPPEWLRRRTSAVTRFPSLSRRADPRGGAASSAAESRPDPATHEPLRQIGAFFAFLGLAIPPLAVFPCNQHRSSGYNAHSGRQADRELPVGPLTRAIGGSSWEVALCSFALVMILISC
jgi:hypothetical protein